MPKRSRLKRGNSSMQKRRMKVDSGVKTIALQIQQKEGGKYNRQWKRNLSAVGDNANWIEENMVAIANELQKDMPDTTYLKKKVENIEEWLDEMELANARADAKKLED